MKNRSDLAEYLSKRWYFYIIWLVISVAVFSFVYTAITAAKKDEKVNIFIAAKTSPALKEKLSDNMPDNIKEINVVSHSQSEDSYGVFYMTNGLIDGDILILPESAVRELAAEGAILAIEKTVFDNNFAGAEPYSYGEDVFGVKAFGRAGGSAILKAYIDYSDGVAEDMYMVFNRRSSGQTEIRQEVLKVSAELYLL